MIERQRIATYGIAPTAFATVALALWLKPWSSHTLIEAPPAPQPTAAHRVDLVFAVDTTGSMGGPLQATCVSRPRREPHAFVLAERRLEREQRICGRGEPV